MGNYSASLNYFINALEAAHDINDKRKVAEAHLNISINMTDTCRYKVAIEQALAAIILLQECINDNMYLLLM
jgi:hypothetical protein